MKISGKTKVCAFIGDPVEHSLSPVIYNAAIEQLELDLVYVVFTVTRNELRNAISGVRSLGLLALNVTMPHKMNIIKYLDEIDSRAKSIGAVNTILNDKGKLIGFNTDGVGAMKALQENGVSLVGRKLLLLGAGGTAKAIAFQVAQEVKELVVLNRTSEKAERLAEVLHMKTDKKVKGKHLTSNILKEEVENADILINATSVGMHPDVNKNLVPKSLLRPDLCVMDVIYYPLETKLLKDAKAVGAKVVSGVEMLIYQGAVSFEIWTNHQAPVKVMKQAVLNKLAELGANQ